MDVNKTKFAPQMSGMYVGCTPFSSPFILLAFCLYQQEIFFNISYIIFSGEVGVPMHPFRREEGHGIRILRDPETQHPQKEFKLQMNDVMHRPLNLTLPLV
jgi:hypothetical protein